MVFNFEKETSKENVCVLEFIFYDYLTMFVECVMRNITLKNYIVGSLIKRQIKVKKGPFSLP